MDPLDMLSPLQRAVHQGKDDAWAKAFRDGLSNPHAEVAHDELWRNPWGVLEQILAASMTNPFPERPGAVYMAPAVRGTAEITVYPLLFGGGRVLLGPADFDGGADAVYDYLELRVAVEAAHAWNGSGHPDGYYRRNLDGKGWEKACRS